MKQCQTSERACTLSLRLLFHDGRFSEEHELACLVTGWVMISRSAGGGGIGGLSNTRLACTVCLVGLSRLVPFWTLTSVMSCIGISQLHHSQRCLSNKLTFACTQKGWHHGSQAACLWQEHHRQRLPQLDSSIGACPTSVCSCVHNANGIIGVS